MNPLTNVKNIKKLSELELKRGNLKSSWHDQYKDSAWIFVGGLPYDLTEGDVICVFSQYGEVVNINLVRDKASGKSKGFCFLCYEDQRSTILAVDNLNGIKILGRTIRVDHVADYKPPKDSEKLDTETRKLYSEGCAPKLTSESDKESGQEAKNPKKEKKEKMKQKKKKKKKKRKKAKVQNSSSSSEEGSTSASDSEDETRASSKTKKSRKKKTAKSESSSASDAENVPAKTKRQQLEEKIRALERALSTVKRAAKMNEEAADVGTARPKDAHPGEVSTERVDRGSVSKKKDAGDSEGGRKNTEERGVTKHSEQPRDRERDRDRERERGRERERDWERSKERRYNREGGTSGSWSRDRDGRRN
ncbi:RNA-binding motif protein, X-linked 2-like isoform X1 [Schistocerca nitens]|uniref:RNA-binding motif protein, X-linked 2-like isoform X1 n=1 Tax=Schistocerca nitens TaxID=7011 RepID=UPI0021173DC7|nr:RNA-binding motif protein, X-linked 2-like isoform X1 [Schistocerca nitens]